MLEIAASRQCGSRMSTCSATAGTTAPRSASCDPLSYTHDILRSRTSLANLMRLAKPGRVTATSTALRAVARTPNWYLRLSHRGYITNFEGMDARD